MVVHAEPCKAVEWGTSGNCSCWPIPQQLPAPIFRTRVEVIARINGLKASRFTMLEYLDLKRKELDFHGVQDAGSDLRDIEAEIVGLEWVIGERTT